MRMVVEVSPPTTGSVSEQSTREESLRHSLIGTWSTTRAPSPASMNASASSTRAASSRIAGS